MEGLVTHGGNFGAFLTVVSSPDGARDAANQQARRVMRTLLIVGAIVIVVVGIPALGYVIRWMIRRPLTPEQQEREELVRERRRDARYFWR
jgi:hypothetical protein